MLHSLAIDIMRNAYVPYSNFRVGVSIKSVNNRFYVGCNVENAAYPQGVCAEAGAISSMISGGCKLISEVLVVSEGERLIVPCGGCRQKLLEFSNEDTRVLLATTSKIEKNLSIEDLLPFSFDKTFL
jgi:cytidine deaminase